MVDRISIPLRDDEHFHDFLYNLVCLHESMISNSVASNLSQKTKNVSSLRKDWNQLPSNGQFNHLSYIFIFLHPEGPDNLWLMPKTLTKKLIDFDRSNIRGVSLTSPPIYELRGLWKSKRDVNSLPERNKKIKWYMKLTYSYLHVIMSWSSRWL